MRMPIFANHSESPQNMILYIVFKSVYLDNKLSFRVYYFRSLNLQCPIDVSGKKTLGENHKLHNFYE